MNPMQPPLTEQRPKDEGPSESLGILVTVGLAIASSCFGQLYFEFILGVCLTAGVGLGVLTKLPLVGTALQLLVMGSMWGVVLFILAGAGFFRFIFEE